MPEQPEHKEIREYADGWITERSGTDAPAFLKLSFIVIGLGCVAYFLYYMYGEINHPDRGPLVQQFNKVSETSPVLMYAVAGMALVFVICVVVFSFRKFHED